MLTFFRSATTVTARSRLSFLPLGNPIRYSLVSNVDDLLCRCYSADEKRPPRRRRVDWNNTPTVDSSAFQNDVESPKSLHLLRPTPVQNEVEFERGSYALLDALLRALRPMEDYNDFFQVCVRHRDEVEHEENLLWELSINLKPSDGTYRLVVDRESCNLVMSSPVSGTYTYVLCQSSGDWVGQDDGHSLIGLLVRDLGRQCNGYPNF